MSRSIKESLLAGGRNAPLRRGRTLNGSLPRDADENLDLFSKNRPSFSLALSDDTEVSVKLGRLSLGSIKMDKNGIDDLLSFPDGGKNDYDWLLTPPGTPLVASDCLHHQPATAAPRSSSASRNGSTMKTSRLSVTHTESNHSSRPARSSSVTRPSVSASQYTYFSSNRSSSILNTSSASVSSYIRPSSPMTRAPSVSRPSTSSSRPTLSRSTTPSRVRSMPSSSSIDKPRPSSNSRPSTPTSRIPNPPNLTSPVPRSNSRPSTPNRRMSAPSLSTTGTATTPGRRLSSSGLTTSSATGSRPSSPSPRLKSLTQPPILPPFPHETPSNLRTTLSDRPLSAGRSRPGLSVTGKGKTDTSTVGNLVRRQPSPVGTKGRLPEPTAKVRAQSNGHTEILETRRTMHLQDSLMNKSIRVPSATSDSNGFGRTISKKSLDMAVKHMDIRNGTGNTRQLSGTALFPQSIRSSPGMKTLAVRTSSDFGSTNNASMPSNSGYFENGSIMSGYVNGRNEEISHLSAKLREVDIYESSRYDAILLKEDLKNTNWLHSFDEHSNQGSLFDTGFETLPEPFDPL
ncbi:unnamed protein product [Rhodiola kirilowii]